MIIVDVWWTDAFNLSSGSCLLLFFVASATGTLELDIRFIVGLLRTEKRDGAIYPAVPEASGALISVFLVPGNNQLPGQWH